MYYEHHGTLSTHMWLIYLCGVHTHKHMHLHEHTHIIRKRFVEKLWNSQPWQFHTHVVNSCGVDQLAIYRKKCFFKIWNVVFLLLHTEQVGKTHYLCSIPLNFKLRSTFKVVSDIYNFHLLPPRHSGKLKSQARLHYTTLCVYRAKTVLCPELKHWARGIYCTHMCLNFSKPLMSMQILP